jgi:hypothetical protein
MSAKRRHPSSNGRGNRKGQRGRPRETLRGGDAPSHDDERFKRKLKRMIMHRVHLNAAHDAIQASLVTAGLEHARDAVVLLLDLSDQNANSLVDNCVDRTVIDGVAADSLRSGKRPLGTWALRKKDAVRVLKPRFPVIAADIEELPSGRGFCVVVVVAEGATSGYLLQLATGTPDDVADDLHRTGGTRQVLLAAHPDRDQRLQMDRQAEQIASHAELLHRDIEKVEMSYVRAVELGAAEPAVLLLDATDGHAREILDTIDQPERMTAHAAKASPELTPLATWGIPGQLAQSLLALSFPETAAEFEALDPGEGYRVAVIADGGASVFVMPPIPGGEHAINDS